MTVFKSQQELGAPCPCCIDDLNAFDTLRYLDGLLMLAFVCGYAAKISSVSVQTVLCKRHAAMATEIAEEQLKRMAEGAS